MSRVKEQLDQARIEFDSAQRDGDLLRMSELQYAVIPKLEEELSQVQKSADDGKKNKILRNKVTKDEVAQVVAKWTGIPVDRMMESERHKILHLDELT